MNKGKHIVLFDGVCNFCNASVNFVIDRDKAGKLAFASLQSDIGRNLLKENNYWDTQLTSVLFIKNGKVYEKSDAALEIARELSGAWSMLYAFKIVPRPLRNLVYDWIARNRYKWFGQQDSCRIPTPELKARFIG